MFYDCDQDKIFNIYTKAFKSPVIEPIVMLGYT